MTQPLITGIKQVSALNSFYSQKFMSQVWEGQGVISYGRKLIGATDPQKSEPGTIRGDLAVVVGR